MKKVRGEEEKPRGFGRVLDPERIIGATDSSGELKFLIKWIKKSMKDQEIFNVTNAQNHSDKVVI